MSKLILVAIGGNELIRAGQQGTAQEQFENAVDTALAVVRLIKAGHRVVLTHGNGPQVGAMLTRTEMSAANAYRMPVDCCVAATQGEMGYVLQYAMWQAMQQEGLKTTVVSLVTQVLVSAEDSAFMHPTKPIGPYYPREVAERYRDLFGWNIIQDRRGYRRVVSSPEPKEIIEIDAIMACVDRGFVVIAGGGGGVPVFNDHDLSKGVEAVIDKDHTSAILAAQLNADIFAISTEVEKVCLDYNKPTQRVLDRMTVRECELYLEQGQFPPGNMGPKITAAMMYLTRGGKEAIITNHEHLFDAVHGRGGTHITCDA